MTVRRFTSPSGVRLLLLLTAMVTTCCFRGQRLGTGFVGRASLQADVDRDHSPEEFKYSIRKANGTYEASLTIEAASGRSLWSHEWKMQTEDLEEDLLLQEGGITSSTWVSEFFSGNLIYGARLERTVLHASELQEHILVQSARRLGIQEPLLSDKILSQPEHVLFSYRATWREDLVKLVYVPDFGRFVRYSAGDY